MWYAASPNPTNPSVMFLSSEISEALHRFHPVVHDGAISRAIHELPHAAGDGAVAANQMREALAVSGARFVHGALVSFEEYAASSLNAAQDQLAVAGGHGVPLEELLLRNAEVAGQMFDIALHNSGLRHAAAFGAGAAIDGVLNFLGFANELALHVIVRLDPAAKAEILVQLLFAHAPDLNQIGEHCVDAHSGALYNFLMAAHEDRTF